MWDQIRRAVSDVPFFQVPVSITTTPPDNTYSAQAAQPTTQIDVIFSTD